MPFDKAPGSFGERFLIGGHGFAGEIPLHVFREGRIVQSGTPQSVLDEPASADIARLLGIYNLLPAEILALDPGRNTSRLRVGEWEINGVYFPGQLKGDRVTL